MLAENSVRELTVNELEVVAGGDLTNTKPVADVPALAPAVGIDWLLNQSSGAEISMRSPAARSGLPYTVFRAATFAFHHGQTSAARR
jgi:hypothetical protein